MNERALEVRAQAAVISGDTTDHVQGLHSCAVALDEHLTTGYACQGGNRRVPGENPRLNPGIRPFDLAAP